MSCFGNMGADEDGSMLGLSVAQQMAPVQLEAEERMRWRRCMRNAGMSNGKGPPTYGQVDRALQEFWRADEPHSLDIGDRP